MPDGGAKPAGAGREGVGGGLAEALERLFRIRERGSSVGRELRGALATFLTMAYILFVNPAILAAAGIPPGPATACTAAAAGICCLLMGFGANFPIALASGMGLNAVVALQVAPAAGSWQAAMGLVVLDGLVVLALVLTGVREAVLEAIPEDLRRAIGAGIGLFIAFIGLVNAGIVVRAPGEGPVPVTFGHLTRPDTALAAAGLALTATLFARRAPGALLLGILATTAGALLAGVARLPTALPPPSFALAFQADLRGALRLDLLPLLFALLMVDFFDTLGTVTALAEQAGLRDARGRIPGLRRILIVDSLSAAIGGLFGVSSVTSYIESAAGIAEGARTGLHSVGVGLLFLLAILAAPLAAAVPPAATAPALLLVGFLMISQVAGIRFDEPETAIPAFVILLAIPVTYSIAHGIGYGFLLFASMKLLAGKAREVHPLMYAAAGLFLAYFLAGEG